MKATVDDEVIAESGDIVEVGGYAYFPAASVSMRFLEKAPKNDSDRACPHGVQFYDVVTRAGRHGRAAWSYEAPLPRMEAVRGRFGFWNDVAVA
jgi:uncharacterized protein (DUF427 family)